MATTEHRERFDEAVADLEDTYGMVPPPLNEISDEDLVAEWPTFTRYTVGETEIPEKYRELIGLAVAANLKCPYCVHFHRGAAQLHGATDDEIQEAVTLASFTSRYSAMLHALEYDLDEFKAEVAQIAEHLQQAAEASD